MSTIYITMNFTKSGFDITEVNNVKDRNVHREIVKTILVEYSYANSHAV